MDHFVSPGQDFVGQFRRFGSAGPVYQVVANGRIDEAGRQWMQVHIFDSGEDVEYRLEELLDDPQVD